MQPAITVISGWRGGSNLHVKSRQENGDYFGLVQYIITTHFDWKRRSYGCYISIIMSFFGLQEQNVNLGVILLQVIINFDHKHMRSLNNDVTKNAQLLVAKSFPENQMVGGGRNDTSFKTFQFFFRANFMRNNSGIAQRIRPVSRIRVQIATSRATDIKCR